MKTLTIEEIFRFSKDILMSVGVSEEQASIISDSIVDAHRCEKHTHGMGRLSIYVRKIQSGQMAAETVLTPIRDNGIITVLDANDGFGQVAAYQGIQTCLEKAETFGVGIVGIRNSNSFGAAGYFGNLIAENQMIGMIMGNASKALCPPGGNQACLGTNPICFAFPGTSKHPNIVLDMACAVAARGKVRLALKNGESIPEQWGNDAKGMPSTDPAKVLEGSINAFGGYKGFGLATVVEMMAGVITGSSFADMVLPLNTPTGLSRYGHFLCALSPQFFMDADEYEKRVDHLIEYIQSCGETGCVYMPGEQSQRKKEIHTASVQVPDTIVQDMNALAQQCNVKQIMYKELTI